LAAEPWSLAGAMLKRTLWTAFLAQRALASEAGSGAPPRPSLCQLSEPSCGSAEGQCFNKGQPVTRFDDINLCVGFQSADSTKVQDTGKKAIFSTSVDEYATLSINTLAPIVQSSSLAAKEAYQYVWVGARDKRTIGQQFGWASDDDSTCLSEAPPAKADSDNDCIGWRLHNKPLLTRGGRLISSITAIIHVDMGVIKSVMWDSSCNLCPGRDDGLRCMEDNTTVVCSSSWWGGSAVNCSDCYADITMTCGAGGSGCAPKIYFAWVGTDKHGQNMLSAGRVLSRFAGGSVQGAVNVVEDKVAEVTQ